MDNNANHAIKQTLVPSSKLKHELVVAAGTVLVHLTGKYQQLYGDDKALPDSFVKAWANFGDHLTDGSTGQFQAFVEAANACPPMLVETLVRVSLHLSIIPESLVEYLITQLALQLNNMPKEGVYHG